MRRFALPCAAAALVIVSAGAPAFAGRKPAPDTNSTFALQVLSGGDAVPTYGDDVSFDVATSATSEPHVDLTCAQGGAVVYGATAGFYDSYPWPWTKTMNLKSQDWAGGAADCTARLYYFSGRKVVTLRTLTFHADG